MNGYPKIVLTKMSQPRGMHRKTRACWDVGRGSCRGNSGKDGGARKMRHDIGGQVSVGAKGKDTGSQNATQL